MASDNPALNFVEYMKGVGDSAVNIAEESAYGVYDFGQVAVGGAKIAAKEGLSAIGANEAAAKIMIEDIEPLSALGKAAAQGGYEGLGDAVKSMPGNMAHAVADAVWKGDMRALGGSVTDAVLMAEGARAGVVGAAKSAGKAAAALRPAVNAAAEAATEAAGKAKAALGKAKASGNPEIANKATAACEKKNDVKLRIDKGAVPDEHLRFRGKIKYHTAEDANAELIDRGRATRETPPFKEGTTVAERDMVPGERFNMSMDDIQLGKLINPNSTEGVGGWGTTDMFSSQAEALNKMAIDQKWKPNGIPKTVEFEVVKPFRTLDGIAGPQGSLSGGAQQYFLDLPRNTAKEFVRIVNITTLP